MILNLVISMNKLINILLAVSMVVLGACREEFWPDLTKYENLIVVDGLITNDPGPYEVKLSFSTAVQNPEFNPFSGAQVVIMDNEGTSKTLTETSPGIYKKLPKGRMDLFILKLDSLGNFYWVSTMGSNSGGGIIVFFYSL